MVWAYAYYTSEENEKGFSEGDRRDGWNEIRDFVSWYTGRKLQKPVSIAQRKLIEQPSDPPAVSISQRYYGTIEDALL